MIGVYPIGTVVLLGTGEVALVVATNPDLDHLHLPRVKFLFDRQGVRWSLKSSTLPNRWQSAG